MFFYSTVNNIAYHFVAYHAGAGVVVVQWYSTYTTCAHIIVCSALAFMTFPLARSHLLAYLAITVSLLVYSLCSCYIVVYVPDLSVDQVAHVSIFLYIRFV